MTIGDHDALIELMRQTPGVAIRDADSRESTARYLDRNPGLSFVAEAGPDLIGAVMCGHDGRRGYLQHLVVQPAQRGRGIGGALVSRCLDALQALGIMKCHIDVFVDNAAAIAFWEARGWARRIDIHRYSFVRGDNANA
jgi:ribosomal protein S18 acetylase RimI-like enzyme